MIRITPETLEAAGSCGDHLEVLDSLGIPDGIELPEWTLAHQCAILWDPTARRHLGWMWARGVLPQWSMADLQAPGADLDGANLRGANLRGANLRGADLVGTDLGGADLGGASLRGANLSGAHLRGAYLRGADLRGACLGGANLGGASLDGANLSGADLSGASLGGAYLGPWERDPDGIARRRAA